MTKNKTVTVDLANIGSHARGMNPYENVSRMGGTLGAEPSFDDKITLRNSVSKEAYCTTI